MLLFLATSPPAETLESFWSSSGIWAVAGVVVGFALAEVSRLVRDLLRRRRRKRALRHELKSNLGLIPQKIDIIDQILAALKTGKVLPGACVPAMSKVFEEFGAELQPYLSEAERSCLHIIYGHLASVDRELHEFESRYITAVRDGVPSDPRHAFSLRLTNLRENCQTVQRLIGSYLEGRPEDVLWDSA